MTQTSTSKDKPNLFHRYIPIVGWLPTYRRDWLRPDVIAGLTVVALLVPEGMAYAELAGMPPQTAFYAAIPALILYALFGTSKQLVVATSSTIAAMSASVIAGLAPAGTEEFILLTSMLAILAGLASIIAGLFRMGAISQFFSESVLTGFVFGLALVIAVKQLPKIFGLEAAEGNFWERIYDLIIHLPEVHWVTLLVGITSLLLMLILEERWPRLPAALITLIYGIAVVTIFQLAESGVHIVGEIPSGLVAPRVPDVTLRQALNLLPGAFAIALVAFAEAIGPARNFAGKYRYKIDPDEELIAIGTANLGAGLFQGYSIGASLSKSAANDNAGAKSSLSLIVAAGITALVALFFTGFFYNLPEATLAAIVVVAVKGMMNVAELRRLYRLRRSDFALALVALLAVLTFEILAGLLIAVVLSLIILIARAARPKYSIIGRAPGRLDFGDIQRHPDYRTVPGLIVIHPNEGVWFANATPLREEIVGQVRSSQTPVYGVLLDLNMTYEIDVPGLDMLSELKEDLKRYEVRLFLANVHQELRHLMDQSRLSDKIGRENITQTVTEGVLQYLETRGELTPEEAEHIVATMPHLLDFIEQMANITDDESEKQHLHALRERLKKVDQFLKTSSDDEN